jgi:RNA polymerase sigma-32 factor
MEKVREELESNQGKEEKYEIVARDFAVAKQDIIEMEQRMSARDLYLDASFDEDNELTHLDLLQGDGPDQEQLFAQEEERKIQEERINNAMKVLSEKEAYVIKNRIMAYNPLTLQQIGNYLKVTRERVRQIEGEALAKLKRNLNNLSANQRPPSQSCYPKLNLRNFQRRELPLQQGMFH